MPSGLNRRSNTGQKNYTRGKRAETFAFLWMLCKGYLLVSRRVSGWRGTGVGELDLVLKRGRTLVFVEVKYRQSRAVAVESVSVSQQKRIIRGAESFLQRHPNYKGWNCRFDLIVIAPWRLPHHIPNAWTGW